MNINLIHKENPYNGFDYKKYPLDLQGWGSTDPNFKKLIDEICPELIIEVGSWKGGSAIFMAEYIKKKNIDCKIVCVDTWLGALEFLTDKADPDRYISLNKKNGYPNVYFQFLANVMYKEAQDYIIPFPQTSAIGAQFFEEHHIQADMIYIDASHEFDDVIKDLHDYWNILKIGGVLFGDDYNIWPGVTEAVDLFSNEYDVEVIHSERQWSILKKSNIKVDKDFFRGYLKNKEKILILEKDKCSLKDSEIEYLEKISYLETENTTFKKSILYKIYSFFHKGRV